MYGVIDFYRAAKKAGINPILGCEVYVAPGSRFDREQVKGEDRYYHLVLLAENNVGYAESDEDRLQRFCGWLLLYVPVWIWKFWRPIMKVLLH